MEHTDFALAFTDGATLTDDAGTIATMRTHPLGDLVAPTGRLIACDPLAAVEMTPFAQRIAPGRYSVMLSVAALANEDERVACAMLRLSDAPVVRWEMARLEGQESVTLLEDEFFGFPVEAGVACLMDERAATALDARFDADEHFAEQLIDQMESNATSTWDSANVPLDAESGANVVLYASGWGDGIYASYWGYAADETLACLVTDFGVI